MDQSEFEANTCDRRQAREKSVRARHDWFWFCFSLVESGANFSEVKQNQSKREITFDTQLKTALIGEKPSKSNYSV